MSIAWKEIVRRYGLAACCIVGPILFGLVGYYYATTRLLPVSDPQTINLPYAPAGVPDDARQANAAAPAPGGGQAASTAGTPPAPAPSCTSSQAAAPDAANNDAAANVLVFWTIGRHLRGRITYAIASAFIYLIAGAVLVFALSIVGPQLGLLRILAALLIFAGLAWYFASFVPPGRTFIVERPLRWADSCFPVVDPLKMGDDTGKAAAALVRLNTVVSFCAIGMLLLALFVLSVRAENEDDIRLERLQARLTLLRIGLGLGSAFLVIGVLAQNALVEWPLALIQKQQAAGLRLAAGALTLQIGAQGTIALIAAFGPAIAAWSLDAAVLRRKMRDGTDLSDRSTEPPAEKPKAADSLAFAPLSAIASFLAMLAPLLASPVIDLVKALFSTFSR